LDIHVKSSKLNIFCTVCYKSEKGIYKVLSKLSLYHWVVIKKGDKTFYKYFLNKYLSYVFQLFINKNYKGFTRRVILTKSSLSLLDKMYIYSFDKMYVTYKFSMAYNGIKLKKRAKIKNKYNPEF
jgi:hypothetical protein